MRMLPFLFVCLIVILPDLASLIQSRWLTDWLACVLDRQSGVVHFPAETKGGQRRSKLKAPIYPLSCTVSITTISEPISWYENKQTLSDPRTGSCGRSPECAVLVGQKGGHQKGIVDTRNDLSACRAHEGDASK